MKQFSPALRTTVANFQLSHYVANIPFLRLLYKGAAGSKRAPSWTSRSRRSKLGVGSAEVWRRATIVAG